MTQDDVTSFYRWTNAFNVFNTMKNKSVIFKQCHTNTKQKNKNKAGYHTYDTSIYYVWVHRSPRRTGHPVVVRF